MTNAKRQKMVDEDDVGYGDEIENKIKIKREWGERFEREEEIRRGPGELEEIASEETNAESRERMVEAVAFPIHSYHPHATKKLALLINNVGSGTILLRVRHHYYGGGGEEEGTLTPIEGEVVAVPAASLLSKPRDRSSGKKRNAVAQLEGAASKVKKAKRPSPRNSGSGEANSFWTAEEDTALLEAVDEYGFDWGRIKKKYGAFFRGRTAEAIYKHFLRAHPEKHEELMDANPNKFHNPWTEEQDEAVKRGVEMHGKDWEKIYEAENILKRRNPNTIRQRHYKMFSPKVYNIKK
ncbi:hypothetical protein TrLO_g11336 [Triparma laevis f. longispina]|uniref:Uncharacterized protein n=1 Tax=Triparma laevis f. longispina TaxID=1714387 RepID=A0A9W7F3M3_9STRA|nr:hypothetical protein TrLO_g11336 [Triparma laevis f. longispina]